MQIDTKIKSCSPSSPIRHRTAKNRREKFRTRHAPLTNPSIDSKTTAAIRIAYNLSLLGPGSNIGIALPKPNAVRCHGHGGIATTQPSCYGLNFWQVQTRNPNLFVDP